MHTHIESYTHPFALTPVVSLTKWSSQSSVSEDESIFLDIPDPAPEVDAALDSVRLANAIDNFVLALSLRDQEIVERVFWKDES